MARGHAEIVHADEVAPQPLPAAGWPPGAELLLLSSDPDTGAFSGLLDLPAGYRRGQGWLTSDTDLFVLEGTLRCGRELRGAGWYEWLPAGSTQAPWSVDERCRLLLLPRSGRPDFVPGQGADPPGRIALDTALVPWQLTPIPGMPPGFVFKTLRHDPETGETCALYAATPRRSSDGIEFHDCAEEVFLIDGEIRSGTAGLMRSGSYFWRPAYITHGPFSSRRGNYCFLYVDSTLVNHFVDDVRATPGQNRAQAAREEPPRNHIREAGLAGR